MNSSFRKVVAELECPVCLEVTPSLQIVLPCAHTVCRACISHVTRCPTCRSAIDTVKPNYLANNIAKVVNEEQENVNLMQFEEDLTLFAPCLKENAPPSGKSDRVLHTLRRTLRESVFDERHLDNVHQLIDHHGLPTVCRVQLKQEADYLASFRSR